MLRQALLEINQIPHSVDQFATTEPINEQLPSGTQEHVSASAPPISSTKGSRAREQQGGDVPLPHFKRKAKTKHTRRCTGCGKTGHKITTCGREVPPKRPRGRPAGSGRGRGRGRTRMANECHMDADYHEETTEDEDRDIADDSDENSDNNL